MQITPDRNLTDEQIHRERLTGEQRDRDRRVAAAVVEQEADLAATLGLDRVSESVIGRTTAADLAERLNELSPRRVVAALNTLFDRGQVSRSVDPASTVTWWEPIL